MDDTRNRTFNTGDKAGRIISAIHAQVRDAVDSGNLTIKSLCDNPGVSRSTVARIMSDETPSDQQFSTIFYIIDRLPEEQRLPVIQTLTSQWGVRVTPMRDIETDLDGNGIVDAKDEREAAMCLLDACNRAVRHAVDAVEDGTITDSEHAMSMRLRTEINRTVDVLVSVSGQIVQNELTKNTQRRKALTPHGPRMASAV